MIIVRKERPGDVAAVRKVEREAFNRPDEAGIVDRIRANGGEQLSLVAVDDGTVIGHILFSRATIEGNGRVAEGMGLAPVAVLPNRQKRGIGSRLIRTGLSLLRRKGVPFVIVLGHPTYYPRFGFGRASAHGVRCTWEGVPDDAFMMMALDHGAMRGVQGLARYRPEFDDAA